MTLKNNIYLNKNMAIFARTIFSYTSAEFIDSQWKVGIGTNLGTRGEYVLISALDQGTNLTRIFTILVASEFKFFGGVACK